MFRIHFFEKTQTTIFFYHFKYSSLVEEMSHILDNDYFGVGHNLM